MKIRIVLCLLLLCSSSWADVYPHISLFFSRPPATTVFYGETIRIPVQMNYVNLWVNKIWYLPNDSSLENKSGNCPGLFGDRATYWNGICLMNLIVKGKTLGKVIEGSLDYYVYGQEGHFPHKHTWQRHFNSPVFSVKVIPHYLSMSAIPTQQATANQEFIYNLKTAANYYDENVAAGIPVLGIVSPVEQNGLLFDPARFSIIGKPKRTGTYLFNVGVKNTNSSAQSVDLRIEVGINPKEKPILKKQYQLASAMVGQLYSVNLMDLLEGQTEFLTTNQISFRIMANKQNGEWLHIPDDDTKRLEGLVPKDLVGQEVEIILIASSNAGGDSDPVTVKIPIASEPGKKPQIDFFELEQLAGSQFNKDLSEYIKDPAQDSSLKVTLDKVVPAVSWLSISPLNPTVLSGVIPVQATGQKYQITLRASTLAGGSSDPIHIPLQISVDKERTPRFKAANPIVPLVIPGQPFFYDFASNRDVFPEYEDAPYEIQFAEGYQHPDWLMLKENQLSAAKVPENIDSEIEINIVIKNIPGGASEVIKLPLIVMK